ncbi:cytochrome-c peroxidase [Alteromonas sp. a30]|uniref:cytochrome-c peroxidase n=1 Tax=Alteromonas sp. a30 TaxID=2730917 RepID=UPI0022826B27|nr:cytochrome c peroxidase [Alteromonas sp. a30]MCY7295838.1 cytochrome C peroxidase [Alteromonas sp. a30]
MRSHPLLTLCVTALIGIIGLIGILNIAFPEGEGGTIWEEQEVAILRTLAIPQNIMEQSYESLTNRYAGVEEAERFGHRLFFDEDLSINRERSCASCHHPEKAFTDGLPTPISEAEPITRNTPTIVGSGLSAWQFWDGRRDSLWSQALESLESMNEHGTPRTLVALRVAEKHKEEYEAVFGTLPDFSDSRRFPPFASPDSGVQDSDVLWAQMSEEDREQVNLVFTNVGKAIGAYEAKLVPARSRFDEYIASLNDQGEVMEGHKSALNQKEIAGLKLFMDEESAQCISCHNGPMLSSFEFKAINAPDGSDEHTDRKDIGRKEGVIKLLAQEFNCKSKFSDATPEMCDELNFVKADGMELEGAFKVPTLRNVALTAPYMHSGVFNNLDEVLQYYNRPMIEKGVHIDVEPLKLVPHQLEQLEAFLMTLNGGIAVEKEWLQAPPMEGVKQNKKYAAETSSINF